jgi:hypothetical protein
MARARSASHATNAASSVASGISSGEAVEYSGSA